MTIPYMMNCSHTGEGWCLTCVKSLGENYEQLITEVQEARADELALLAKLVAAEQEIAQLRGAYQAGGVFRYNNEGRPQRNYIAVEWRDVSQAEFDLYTTEKE